MVGARVSYHDNSDFIAAFIPALAG